MTQVATDDKRIADAVCAAGGEAVMTSAHCASGPERVSEAAHVLPQNYSVVINVQGDEPLVDPAHIDQMASYMLELGSPVKDEPPESVRLSAR